MLTQPFNPKEYADLKRRVEALRSRVTLDVGPEQKQAERLLVKMEKKLLATFPGRNPNLQTPRLTEISGITSGIPSHMAMLPLRISK